MNTRTIFPVVAIFAIVLAACSVAAAPEPIAPTPSATPSPTATPRPTEPTEPTPAPSEQPRTGTITMVDGVAVDGPGSSVTDAIASGITDPMLVRGILLMDRQGTIWLCDDFAGGGAPTCGDPMLEVIGYPEGTGDWDLANAELTGLQEAEGVLFFTDALIFGVVEA